MTAYELLTAIKMSQKKDYLRNLIVIANLNVCQKSLFRVVIFEIPPYFDSVSIVRNCQVVIKKFDVTNQLRDNKYNYMPKIRLIG